MKGLPLDTLLPYRLAVHLAALRVPPAQRADWSAEWSAELWYAANAHAPGPASPLARHRAIFAFCRGAVADARCMQQLYPAPQTRALLWSAPSPPRSAPPRAALSLGSGSACLAGLAALSLIAAALASVLPGTRAAFNHARRSRNPDRTFVILPPGSLDDASPAFSLRLLRSWERRPQHLFSGFAFAQPVRKAVHIDARHSPELSLVRGSVDLLSLLSLPVAHAPEQQDSSLPRLLLTDRLWTQQFAGSTQIFGQTIHVGLEPVVLGGTVAEDTLPSTLGHPDAILLLPEALAARIPDNARVVAFGRVAPDAGAAATHDFSWHLSIPLAADGETDFTCVSLWSEAMSPGNVYGFTLALAILALPAITSVSLGTYQRHPTSARNCTTHLRGRRWIFLALKAPLAVAASFFLSVDLAFAIPSTSREEPQYILLLAGFTSALFALQWVIRDQRSRCPACLRVLTCPARVGRPSRNFLDWNGTELICNGGHGLLHVPDLPTSWFSHPRWLELDPSWSSLFA